MEQKTNDTYGKEGYLYKKPEIVSRKERAKNWAAKTMKQNAKQCKWLRADTWTCKTGCKKIQVAENGTCPFELYEQEGCPCYR